MASASLLIALATLVLAQLLPSGAPPGEDRGAAARPQPRTTSGNTISALPLAAWAPVSATLGAADSAYRIGKSTTGLLARNAAQHLVARFKRSEVAIGAASGGPSIALSLRSVGYGTQLRAVDAVTPAPHANRVLYAHRGIEEWYANGPLGLEQGFTVQRAFLASRPAIPTSAAPARANTLTLALALTGATHAALQSGGRSLLLGGPGGLLLRYGGLSVSDAHGRTLPARLALHDGRLLIRIDTHGARYPLRIDPFVEQGHKLTGSQDYPDSGSLGWSAALSANGDTALVGGPLAESSAGAAWVFVRSGSTWSLKARFKGNGANCKCKFGSSVALSADGETALIGGPGYEGKGGVWVFVHSSGHWVEQGPILTGAGESAGTEFGRGVALSADGQTALIGGPEGGKEPASSRSGAAWVFTSSGSTWTEQAKLTGAEESGGGMFGTSAALSGEGDTALIGGSADHGDTGAAWVFTRAGSTWTQQGPKLTASGESGDGEFGRSAALSEAGTTALIGGPADDDGLGAAWVFTRSGSTWTQQGPKLTDEGSGEQMLGSSVSLSGSGNTALIGAPNYGEGLGEAWAFTRSGSIWTREGFALTGSEEDGKALFGSGVALSSEATTAVVGGPQDDEAIGALWPYVSSGECTDSWTNTTGGSWYDGADWSKGTPPGPADNACITAAGTYTVTLTETSSSAPVEVKSLSVGGLSGAQTLDVGACSAADDATVATTGSLSDDPNGEIVLSPPAEGCGAAGTTTLSGELAIDGVLSIPAAPAGATRRLDGPLQNKGRITLDASTDFAEAGTLVNEGKLELAAAGELHVLAMSTVENLGGDISAASHAGLLASEAAFVEGAGSTSGSAPVVVDDGTLDYAGSFASHGSGPIALEGKSDLVGDVRSGETLQLQGTCSESALIDANGAFSNQGTMLLTDTEGCAGNVTLALGTGVTLTNEGIFQVEPATGGTRTIEGNLFNNSWMRIAEGMQLQVSEEFYERSGKLEVLIAGETSFGSLKAGRANLRDVLVVRQAPAFHRSLGEHFAIITTPRLEYSFTEEIVEEVNWGGLYYKPEYDASSGVDLVVAEASLWPSPASAAPGATLKLKGRGYVPGEKITFSFVDADGVEHTIAGEAVAGASGEFSIDVTIPSSAAAGIGRFSGVGRLTGVHVRHVVTVS